MAGNQLSSIQHIVQLGVRVPAVLVSPLIAAGTVYRVPAGSVPLDHTSVLKTIEQRWSLQPLTNRSRDNLPNPTFKSSNPYVPTNSPALADLFDAFDFDHPVDQPYTE